MQKSIASLELRKQPST